MDIALVPLILCVAVALFVTEKFSADVVALLVVGALLASGLVTPEEELSGFSNSATLTVAAMFVLNAGLDKTGALAPLGRALIRHGRSETWPLFLAMTAAGDL